MRLFSLAFKTIQECQNQKGEQEKAFFHNDFPIIRWAICNDVSDIQKIPLLGQVLSI